MVLFLFVLYFRMECEEMRGDSEVEIDSDHEDVEGDGSFGGGWLGHSLYNFHTVSTVRCSIVM